MNVDFSSMKKFKDKSYLLAKFSLKPDIYILKYNNQS